MRPYGIKAALAALLLCALASTARAQPVIDEIQELGFDAPESWAMKTFAALASVTALGTVEELEPGAVELGIELSSVPQLSEEERTVGFGGTKTEDLNRARIFGRPRLLVGLPARFSVEVSYVPPVDISGVEPELISIALRRPLLVWRSLRVGAGLSAQQGRFEGDLTCSRDEIEEGPNPFGCESPSNDEMTLDSWSLELTGALALGTGGRWRPFLAVAVHRLDLEFQVDARYGGLIDRTLLRTDGETLSLAAGIEREIGPRSRLALELYWSPLDVVRPPATRAEGDDFLDLRVGYRFRLR